MHEKEIINKNLHRIRVPGGWLYANENYRPMITVFVPDPNPDLDEYGYVKSDSIVFKPDPNGEWRKTVNPSSSQFPKGLEQKYNAIIEKKDGTPVRDFIIFRAKDRAVADTIQAYFNACVKLGCKEQHLRRVAGLLAWVKEYQLTHKTKNPD